MASIDRYETIKEEEANMVRDLQLGTNFVGRIKFEGCGFSVEIAVSWSSYQIPKFRVQAKCGVFSLAKLRLLIGCCVGAWSLTGDGRFDRQHFNNPTPARSEGYYSGDYPLRSRMLPLIWDMECVLHTVLSKSACPREYAACLTVSSMDSRILAIMSKNAP